MQNLFRNKSILYVGRFTRRQGLETLIEAVSKPSLHRLGNIRLTLVSNGSSNNQLDRDRIEKMIWDLGLDNITVFAEGIDRSWLATHYAAADVCVVTSHYNSSGMVAIESMASGTPVIAANVGGLKYAVGHQQTGLLFPAGNVTLLNQALQRMINQPEWCEQLGRSGRSRVEELFTWSDIASQMSEFYHEAIASRNLWLLDRYLERKLTSA